MLGGGLALKGVMDMLKGHFGKGLAPYKANVLTSVYSGLQRPAQAIANSPLPEALAHRMLQKEEDYSVPEAVPADVPPEVAQRILAMTRKGK